MSSQAYPKPVRNAIIYLMFAASAALFVASFTALFPTAQPPRQTVQEQAAITSDTQNPAFGFSPQATDTLGQLMARLKREPDNTELLLDISTLFLDNNSYEQAKGFLTRAVLSNPTHLDARMMLGRCLYLQDNVGGAAIVFEEIIAMQPYAPAMINLGILYKHHLGKKEKARTLFEAVLQINDVEEELAAKATQELAGL